MTIADFKSHFYSGPGFIQLNNSGQALVPDVYREKARNLIDRLFEDGATFWPEAWAQVPAVRTALAKFLGADPAEVAFFTSTATALSQAAAAVRLKSGDEILTWDQEYPTNFYPWRLIADRAGGKVGQVPSVNWNTPVEALLERVNDRTRAIAISWVQYQTGAVSDLRKIADAVKGKDIWLIADVIQGAGVRPFDFHASGFDMVCSGSHKYMCSGYGTGFLLVRKERLEQVPLLEAGAFTYGDPETPKSFTLTPKSDASRFEPGAKCLVEILAMGATLELFAKFGIDEIFKEASRLADILRSGLTEKGFEVVSPPGPIVTFTPRAGITIEQLHNRLIEAKVTHAVRGPGIRLSTHAYTRELEIHRVLNVLGG